MKIVDSFLFSEIFEKELLLLKFMLEDKGIHEWILLENSYSFQGEYIGLHAKDLLDSDERFNAYKHKITIIAKEEPAKYLPKNQFLDEFSFKVEYWQRDLAHDYFINKYEPEDWVMISDVDEMIDFTNEKVCAELNAHLEVNSDGLICVPTKRYWYDFDNEYKPIIGNAMCSKKYLLDTGKKLHHVRAENRKVLTKGWNNIIAFEYSGCYGIEYNLRKFHTSTHTGFSYEDLLQSLRCNHRPKRNILNTKPEKGKRDFFEIVKLNEKNSPKVVRENLSYFKTNIVNIYYRQNRKEDYPELFTIKYDISKYLVTKKEWMKKKIRFALRKLKLEKMIYR